MQPGSTAAPGLGMSVLKLGGLLSLLMAAAYASGVSAMAAPFSATVALLVMLPQAPFSSPKTVLGAHLLSLGAGLALYGVAPPPLLAALLAAWLAIVLMAGLRVLHAPAAAHAVILALGKQQPVAYAVAALASTGGLALYAWLSVRRSAAQPPGN